MHAKWLTIILFLTTFQKIHTQRNNACTNYLGYFFLDISFNCYYEPDVWKRTPEILQNHVGNFETYTVTTEDGYILTIFRIPPKDPDNSRGSIVLQHAMFGNSASWVASGNNSFAFLLWEEGYDVWLPNSRGTFFSEGHVNMTIYDYDYWNFGFHELGIYDIDTILSFIKSETNRNDLIFVGWSVSGTASIVYASLKPEKARDTVKVFIEMNPVVYLKHIHSPLLLFSPFQFIIEPVLRLLHIGSVGSYYSISGLFFKLFYFLPFKMLFVYLMDIFVGWTPNEFDPAVINLLLTLLPQPTSWKTWFHYGQMCKLNGRFTQYDYGITKNFELYNSSSPPQYPISDIQTPIYIISSLQDPIATTQDLETFYQNLPDETKIYGNLTVSGMNHIDNVFGRHRQEHVYDKVLDLLSDIGY